MFFEALALDFLQQQGLKLHSRNVSCRFGELDLICQLFGYQVPTTQMHTAGQRPAARDPQTMARDYSPKKLTS